MTNWYKILTDMAECLPLEEPVHPTLHVGPNLHEALIAAGAWPGDLTLVTPDGQYEDSLTAYVNSVTKPGQEIDMSKPSTCPNGHAANTSGQCGIRGCAHTYLGRHDGAGPAGSDRPDPEPGKGYDDE